MTASSRQQTAKIGAPIPVARTRTNGNAEELSLGALPGAALRACLKEGYSARDLRADLLAGLVVGIIALPLSMALAIAVGVAPQYGLYTAIIAGIAAAALGGSRTQVTGPTAAFVVILAPIYVKFGLAGLLISGFLGGVILLALGLMRMGRFIEFIPHPVTTGFTAGIATVIATLQVKDFLGLTTTENPEHFPERVLAMWAARNTAVGAEAAIGAFTLALLILLPRITRKFPAPLLALPLAALAAVVASAQIPGFQVATVASRFHTMLGGEWVHGIPQLPPLPLLPWNLAGPDGAPFELSFEALRALLAGAFAIAMLGAIESLLSAVVADGMARTRHDPDAELVGQGCANMLVPFFGGIPATGALARTGTNIRYGARTPVASIMHALTMLAAVLALAPLLGHLPMAALAAMLLIVAWNMSDARHFLHIVRVAPRSDVTVLFVCFSLTVLFDMVIGVSVGLMLAAFLFMSRMASVTRTELVGSGHPDLQVAIPPGVLVYEISGPLFFGAAEKAMARLRLGGQDAKVLVLLLEGVHAMDATGLVALEGTMHPILKAHGTIILAGVCEQPMKVLTKAGLHQRPGILFAATPRAALEFAAIQLRT